MKSKSSQEGKVTAEVRPRLPLGLQPESLAVDGETSHPRWLSSPHLQIRAPHTTPGAPFRPSSCPLSTAPGPGPSCFAGPGGRLPLCDRLLSPEKILGQNQSVWGRNVSALLLLEMDPNTSPGEILPWTWLGNSPTIRVKTLAGEITGSGLGPFVFFSLSVI